MLVVYLVLSAVTVALLLLAYIKPGFQVSRSRVIHAAPESIYPQIVDFKHWPAWSPWLIHEPNCAITYSKKPQSTAVGGHYHWNGKLVGEGRVDHVQLNPLSSLSQKIQFFKPMRSSSEINWQLEALGGGATKVTWSMSGSMPFLLRPMAGKMDGFIGPDYELGLALLARESGDESAKLSISFVEDVVEFAQSYLAVPYAGPIADLPEVMPAVYQRLYGVISDHSLEILGKPFALYHRFNKRQNSVESHICVPVDIDVSEMTKAALQKDGLIMATSSAYKAHRLCLTGGYQHLRYVWPCAYAHLRMKKTRMDSKLAAVERYVDSVDGIDANQQITYIDIPIKQ